MSEEKPSIGDHLGNAGKLPTIKFNGRDLKVAYYCPAVADLVEKEIARENIASALELQIIDPGIVESTRRALRKRSHSVGGEMWTDAFSTNKGGVLILWACIAYNHSDFTVDDALKLAREKDAEVSLIYELVLPSFFDQISAVLGLPVETLKEDYKRRLAAIHSTPIANSTSPLG